MQRKLKLCLGAFLLIAAFVGCSPGSTACWQILESEYFRLEVLRDREMLNGAEARSSKANIREAIRVCDLAPSSKWELSSLVGPGPAGVEAMEIAVAANDTGYIIENHRYFIEIQNRTEDVEGYLFSRNYLQIAAYFQSLDALSELLRNGVDPNVANRDGFTTLHFVDGHTSAGLHTIVRLLDGGARTDVKEPNGMTPFEMAVAAQDYRKAMCLQLRGAPEGGETVETDWMGSTDDYDEVLEICGATSDVRAP